MILEGQLTPEQEKQRLLAQKSPVGKNCKCLECFYYHHWEEGTKHVCAAYRDAIPNDIISGKIQHDHLIGNEYVSIVFCKDINDIPTPDY